MKLPCFEPGFRNLLDKRPAGQAAAIAQACESRPGYSSLPGPDGIAPGLRDDGHADAAHKNAKAAHQGGAEPVSSSCCSSIRFAPGVRTQLPITVAGKRHRANTRAEDCRREYQHASRKDAGKTGHDDRSAREASGEPQIEHGPSNHSQGIEGEIEL